MIEEDEVILFLYPLSAPKFAALALDKHECKRSSKMFPEGLTAFLFNYIYFYI